MKQIYDFYITPEEYETAERNGISKKTLEERVRKLAWNKEEAISKPPVKRNWHEWAESAKKHGISQLNFYNRIQYGWSPEEAATRPLTTKQDRQKLALRMVANRKQKTKKANREKARENGIPIKTFHARIRRGWNEERAATILVDDSKAYRRGVKL